MTFLPACQFSYVYDHFNGFCGCLAKIIKNLDLIHNKEAFPVTSFKKKNAVFKILATFRLIIIEIKEK